MQERRELEVALLLGIEAENGTQFDPEVVAAYREIPDSTFERLRESVA